MAEEKAGLPPRQIVPDPPGVRPPTTDGTPVTSAAPAKAKTPPKKKTSGPAQETKDSVREVVETIVFVVVLVLLLKSFVAEAFVIPTGSMAETLYGYQKLVTCPKCAYEFPVNCSEEIEPQQPPGTRVIGATCPNCRYDFNFEDEKMNPSWYTGDRVLVAKFLYDFKLFGLNMPKRQQVVVFKYPKQPQSRHVATNYIKRLIGLPGETIAIYYGKLYVLEGLTYDDRHVPRLDLWKHENMHVDAAVDLFWQKKFRMLRKTPGQTLARRRVVYINDHQAKDLIENKVPPRWAAEGDSGAWVPDKPNEPKRFTYAGKPEAEIAWLRYRYYMEDRHRFSVRRELITDFMGYNSSKPGAMGGQNWVGDLILECDVQLEKAQGQFVMEVSKGVDRFQARWDLATGTCALVRLTGGKEEELASKSTPLKKPGKYRVRFANVDEQLTVWVDGSLPFGDGVVYDPPNRRGPTPQNDLQPASIGAQGGAFTVSKIELWRDTYYTLMDADDRRVGISDADRAVDFGRPEDWGDLQNLKVKTYYVQPDHFLCLGDNSPKSSDGRAWGAVPARLLLGRALLIYYPFPPLGAARAGRIQ